MQKARVRLLHYNFFFLACHQYGTGFGAARAPNNSSLGLANECHISSTAASRREACTQRCFSHSVSSRRPNTHLQGNDQHLRFAGSADLSKAFDTLHVDLGLQALGRMGPTDPYWPRPRQCLAPTTTLHECLPHHGSARLSQAICLPQGDAWSPHSLNAIMAEAMFRITSTHRDQPTPPFHRLYLAALCARVGRDWSEEVARLGLAETLQKATQPSAASRPSPNSVRSSQPATREGLSWNALSYWALASSLPGPTPALHRTSRIALIWPNA